MKLRVGNSYVDGVGVRVDIIHKMNDGRFVGVVRWSQCCDDEDNEDEVDMYFENGGYKAHGREMRRYDLIKPYKEVKRLGR